MSKSGLGFRLSDAEAPPPPRAKAAPSKPLSAADTAKLVARFPAFARAAETKPFALRKASQPPPRPGETIATPFPPPLAPPGAPPLPAGAEPPALVRFAPEGALDTAPNLSLTFSEPMVALSSHAEVAVNSPPARLVPEPPGHFRWIGTQTLLFEPDGERFPKATDYGVEVLAGTRTASGRALAEGKTFRFSLPAVKVESFWPEEDDSTDLEPLVFATFNQRVDRAALLAHVALEPTAPNGAPVALRLATDDEVEADDFARRAAKRAEPGQFVALRPVAPLPRATRFRANFRRGLPSAEGPKTTASDQTFHFETYGSLKLSELECSWYEGCPPLAAWQARFSNRIDASSFERALVSVEPPLPGMKVNVSGNVISIHGRSKGRTKYKVRFAGALRDTFGQTLGKEAEGSVMVDPAEPTLFPEERAMVVLDPAFKPALSVYSVNRRSLVVRLYAVGPEHYARYQTFRQDYDYDGRVTQPPGRLVATLTVRPENKPDELVETRVELSRALENGEVGQVLAVVEPPAQKPASNRWDRSREWVRVWIQATRLGLQAFQDATDLHGWVTKLDGGAPVAGAELGVLKAGAALPASPSAVASGADGMAKWPLGDAGSTVYARLARDVVFLPAGSDGTFRATPRVDRLLWFVMDDRRLYKPGERVHVKGWLRIAAAGKTGDVVPLPAGKHGLSYRVRDPVSNTLVEGAAELDADGGFSLAFDVPKNANLGQAALELELRGPAAASAEHRFHHAFRIEEFRRPEFEVSAETTQGPHLVGTHAIATLRAAYYAGGGLSDADVAWTVTASDVSFTPPNRSGYHFGKPPERFFWFRPPELGRRSSESFSARSNANGEHRLRIDFDALEPAYPRNLALEAGVSDVNRQSWAARTSLLVHPASVTVGLKLENALPTAGQNLAIDTLVTDLEGRAVAGRSVALRCARIETTWRGSEMEQTEHDPATCEVQSASDAVRCACSTKEGGLYRLVAEVTDEHGRKSTTRTEVWVLGGAAPLDAGVRRGRVDLVPDKPAYRGGEEARLLVMAPFAPAEGVLTLEREGIVSLQRFRLEKRVDVVKVRLERAWIPGVTAAVHLVGAAERENDAGEPDKTLPRRPAYANGEAALELPPDERSLELALRVKPAALEPGGTTSIGVDVEDASGRGVPGATVALVVVDEAVLALSAYATPKPLDLFYGRRDRGVRAHETHDLVVLGKPDLSRFRLEAASDGDRYESSKKEGGSGRLGGSHRTAAPKLRAMATAAPAPPPSPSAPAGQSKDEHVANQSAASGTPITLRTNLSPLAAFVPRLVTDARGHAEVRVKLPDNLTRYRVMAVAAANRNQFGSAESDVTARLPLMVRPSAPRFLNFGDKAELPVVLQNQTGEPMTVDVALRADNLTSFEPNGRRLVVPAADRVEVRFPVGAARAGTARVQVGASGRGPKGSGEHADAAEVEIPVWTPATTEAFATYGVVDRGAVAQPVRMPGRVVKEFGGLDITTSSTALQGLSDAVLYVVRYPFDCNEQIASRLLTLAALRDVLAAFSAEDLPKPEVLEKTVALDVQKLADRQTWYGGWDYFRKDRRPDPFVTVHVTHALVRAKAKGYTVNEAVLNRALGYLARLQSLFPSTFPPDARRAVEAYALDVRRRAGQRDPGRARALVREAGGVERMSLEALGWLLPLFASDPASAAELRAVRRHLDNRVTETAGKAHFVTSYREGAHLLLHSDRRADGILLDAFFDDRPESDVIPKLVAGLLAGRKRGRWYTTQENVFVLLGLDRYFQTVEKATPDFVARAWLGSAFAGEHTYRGRTNDRHEVSIPLSTVAAMPEPSPVTLSKEGTGRLYFRIGMRYAPEDLRPPPAEHGFSVTRRYEAADGAAAVGRDADGTWRVRAGSLVRVRVGMVAPARRYHVALVDPLPAGFEPQNSALSATPTIPPNPDEGGAKGGARTPWWWQRAWYEHQNLRDERVEAFASLLWEGVYDYTYVARATTPGDFVVPPPKAEEMYDPETFGRGASDRVVVY
jgi:uncharacterized protein YfaS (alpha-2-macroglobulin family)